MKKKNGQMGDVVGYRALNHVTKKNRILLPRSEELLTRLGGAKDFSKMDLKSGFNQIRMRQVDMEKQAFNTKYGQFD